MQRGFAQPQSSAYVESIDVPIADINPDKCFVIANASAASNYSRQNPKIAVEKVAANFLRVKISNDSAVVSGVYYSWQIIELY